MPPNTCLELRLLGRPLVIRDGRNLTSEIGSKPIAVLAFLAMASPNPIPRDKVAGQFWTDKTEEAARYRLRHTLWELRKILGNELIGSDNAACWLESGPAVWIDALELERGYSSRQTGSEDAIRPDQVSRLAALAELYRGELLEGLFAPEAPFFDEWLLAERERFHLLYQDLLWALAQAQQAICDYDSAAATLSRLVKVDPLHERVYRALMGVHSHRGDRSAALQVYKQCSAVLKSELGIAPSPETERVRNLIAHAKSDSAASQLTTASTLVRQARYQEAWTICATAEALTTDPIAHSQIALLRAEIALSQGKPSESLKLVHAARQAIANILTR